MHKFINRQIIFISASTILSAFSMGSIITFTDPRESNWLTFGFFYASLLLVALGLFTIIGLVFRQFFAHGLYAVNLSNSFRQAVLISLLIVGSLMLQAQGLLFWWVEVSLILFMASLEAFMNLKS